jgi:dTDP-4-amino-4,6-dideoxygalactose transaminase
MLIDFFYSKYVFNFFTYYVLKIPNNILNKLMYPGVFPKFNKSIPKHYFYKFQKHFAIAGIENLKTIDAISKRRSKKVKLYEIYLRKDLLINNFSFREINSFLEYPILLKKNNSKFLSKKLLKKGYDIRHTWYVNSARYLKVGHNSDNIINCEYLHEKVLSLPTHNNIQEQDIKKFVN